MMNIRTASDLGRYIRNIRHDCTGCGVDITDDIARDTMHSVGITRYEELDSLDLDRLIEAAVAMALAAPRKI
jgi:hypothetical protein